MGSHFYFSIGGIFIASVDPPSRESTDHGLRKVKNLMHINRKVVSKICVHFSDYMLYLYGNIILKHYRLNHVHIIGRSNGIIC